MFAPGEIKTPISMTSLNWLPKATSEWRERLANSHSLENSEAWESFIALARYQLSFPETLLLDRTFTKRFGSSPPQGIATKPVKLALLGSATVDHLLPALRVAALRRGLWVPVYIADYNQYMGDICNARSKLHQFAPNVVLFSFDAPHLFGAFDPGSQNAEAGTGVDPLLTKLRDLWRSVKESFGCSVIQQSVIPLAPNLFGNNEHRLGTSQLCLSYAFNEKLRPLADQEEVDILSVDHRVMIDGIDAWHNPVLWHGAKQEISPVASMMYGDLVARLLAAQQGRSYKCMVLDLDNTLWGGVIGDDGLEGITLGQGSTVGEAFLSVQQFALDLAKRGVILAVCSKNDPANALAAFEQHPEMLLRRSDISCFVANWNDKASNLRAIARQLNIGIDSLVFVDDNAAERDLIRRELPMVAVPELPGDPALYTRCISDAGYFESIKVTEEDLARTANYRADQQREILKEAATDLDGYLKNLRMELQWGPVDRTTLPRVVQLINKTNQFNLTTRRYTQAEVESFSREKGTMALYFRLLDRFGDNGIIAVVIGMISSSRDVLIDTWLMSCRVLGRTVEQAVLNVMCSEASRLGAVRLIGEYRPTKKNNLVRDHYSMLGFKTLQSGPDDFARSYLSLDNFKPRTTHIEITGAQRHV
jgi:FkbH-like protein